MLQVQSHTECSIVPFLFFFPSKHFFKVYMCSLNTIETVYMSQKCVCESLLTHLSSSPLSPSLLTSETGGLLQDSRALQASFPSRLQICPSFSIISGPFIFFTVLLLMCIYLIYLFVCLFTSQSFSLEGKLPESRNLCNYRGCLKPTQHTTGAQERAIE